MCLVLFILFLFIGICVGEEDLIYKITILGNVKVEEGVIQGAVKSREGRMFSTEQVREDMRSIFNLGYFTDVQVDIKSTPKGKEVIFIVVEKPSIREVLITGNRKVKLADIKEKVTLTPRSILNLEKVKENAEQIRKLYFSKGYYGVKVDDKIDYLESNEAVVNYKITEGPKGHIKKITFKGNKHIKSSDLRKVMTTKQWNLLSFISKTGVLDEDILKNDLQLLTAYYFDHGYLDVKVSGPKIDLRDPKRTRIEIDIVEGQPYRFGNIDFRGDFLTTKEDLFKVIKIKRDHIYSNTAIREDISALTLTFANEGYAYVEITPETSIDPRNLLVHLTFDIEKKKRVSFEKIQIVGNTKTREKVIRRELQIAEGELYNATGLNKSRDRLKRTGYFKEVEFTTSRGSTDERINLNMKVEEAPTGSFSFGVGYSSLDKVIGAVAVSDRNLFGLGYSALLRFQLGFVLRDITLSFTDPYFLGYRYAAGFDLYNQKRDWDTYSYKITGGDIRLGKELTETIRADMTYKLENVNVYNVANEASQFVKDQSGKKTTSALSLALSTDTRDDYYAPTRGARHSFYIQDAGGIFGGDNYYVKMVGLTSWYFPMPLKTVLNLRGQVGFMEPYGGRLAPIYEKFYVGGIQTLRGFEYGKAGPLDINNEPIGSEKMVVFNSELLFPLSREIGLRGAVFWDVGKGFDRFSDFTPLKTGIGVGIRWFSPIGPIQIDLGFNPIRKPGEKRMVIDFMGGSAF
jgi:outer membrane protein insertion porin family